MGEPLEGSVEVDPRRTRIVELTDNNEGVNPQIEDSGLIFAPPPLCGPPCDAHPTPGRAAHPVAGDLQGDLSFWVYP